MARYLMQHPSGYVYSWTLEQAKRKDMVEISEEEANRRLPAQAKGKPARSVGQELKVIAAEVPEPVSGLKEKIQALPENDQGLPINEEMPAAVEMPLSDDPNKVIDPDIKMLEEIRVVGKGKAKIELYMLEKYSIDVDRRLKLDLLVDQAVQARNKELSSNTGDPEKP